MEPVVLPRIVISAPHRSSGKSTVTTGLCAALTARGLVVQPFKKGPDFIDPMWHEAASGRKSRNLDIFMMGGVAVLRSFAAHAAGSDISVIEGNMGLYDGLDMEGSDSTAGLARMLGAPVILVIDARGMTRGIAPLVKGFESFEPGTNVAGVILNRVKNSRHEKKLRQAIEKYCDAKVLGALPSEDGVGVAMRHLGLVPLKEDEALSPAIAEMGRVISENADLDRILDLARSAPQFIPPVPETRQRAEPTVTIAVAADNAFTFYYPDNLEALEDAGARLVYFSPMRDGSLPKADALYIGGGFPEVHMAALEANVGMREAVRAAAVKGMPIYAECGGLMYLCRSISWKGERREMAGVFPYDIKMSSKPAGHGYVEMMSTGSSPWPAFGERVRAHEFHHSSVEGAAGVDFAYRLERGKGVDGFHDGLFFNNVLAGYSHLHALGTPGWAFAFVNFVKSL